MASILKKLPDPLKVAGIVEMLAGAPCIVIPNGALKRFFGIEQANQSERVAVEFFGSAILCLGIISYLVATKSKDPVTKYWTAVGMLIYNALIVLFAWQLPMPGQLLAGGGHLLATIHFALYVMVNSPTGGKRN